MTSPSPNGEILSALGIAVVEVVEEKMVLAGPPPDWLLAFCPSAEEDSGAVDLAATFPVIENFLVDAEQFWTSGQSGRLRSGAWLQTDTAGKEWAMEVSATSVVGARLLLVEALGEAFEEQQAALQTARDKGLALERLGQHTLSLAGEKQRLETRNREIERLNEFKDEFLASMSHELRTPLNAIIGFSSLLAEEYHGPLNEKQKGFLKHVNRAGEHLLALINDILDLSRIEAGHETLHLTGFDLSEAAGEVLSNIRPLVAVKQIRLRVGVPGYLVHADRTRLKQILYNLLSNAVKFTGDGGSISVEARTVGNRLRLSVTDTGIGVKPEDRKAIFDRFYQGSSASTRVKEGAGLGLAITKRLVELHGGEIRHEAPEAGGSRFVVTIPNEVHADAAGKAARGGEAVSPPAEVTPAPVVELSVAIVEDDSASAALLSAMLEPGCHPTVYESGRQALEAFLSEPPELVLLDISLPDLDGRELLKLMRGNASLRDVPVIAISAHAMEGDRERFLKAGFNDYLPKPVTDRSHLLEKVRKLVSCRS